MFKALAFCSLFIMPSLFASDSIEFGDNAQCRQARFAMAKSEEKFMPGDRTFCLGHSDCTFLSVARWRIAVGINKISLAGYQRMIKDPAYKALAKQANQNCSRNHPHIVFSLPKTAHCYDNTCVPIWE